MAAADASAAQDDTLVQYVLLRKDLKGYGTGALVAQGAHAATAAVWASRDAPHTRAYCGALEDMHKVVLQGEGAEALRATSVALAGAGVAHHLWLEKPEMTVTALATAPGPRGALRAFFAAFKLLR